MKIVLVSDKNSTISIVENLITKSDELFVISDGKISVNTVNENDADLVISDFQVGEMGGIAVALEVVMEQEMGRCKQTPFLLLLDREVDKFLANRVSCESIQKPFSIFELKAKIESIC